MCVHEWMSAVHYVLVAHLLCIILGSKEDPLEDSSI